ncbi:unnamed protein product [Calypogeia fissa]
MVYTHLSATQLSEIDLGAPAGRASLAAIFGEVLRDGMAAQEEEKRKAAEDKKNEKKKKKDEAAKAGVFSPQAAEKQRRKEECDAVRKKREEQKKKEEERKKLPLLALEAYGIPSELAYIGAKNTIKHIVNSSIPRGSEWGKLSRKEQKEVMSKVKDAFRNGADLDETWLADKISNSLSQARYHDRMKIRAYLDDQENFRNLKRPVQFSEELWNNCYPLEVQIRCCKALHAAEQKLKKAKEAGKTVNDLKALEQRVATHQQTVDEVGKCPKKFILAVHRVVGRPKVTHRVGQSGLPGLKAAFYKKYRRRINMKEIEIGMEHGKKRLFELTDEALASEEDSDEEEEEEEEEEVSSDLEDQRSRHPQTSRVVDSTLGVTPLRAPLVIVPEPSSRRRRRSKSHDQSANARARTRGRCPRGDPGRP